MKIYILMNDKEMIYSILQTEKNKTEIEAIYEADEIREMESIEQAREHGKGYAIDDHSVFYK